MLVFNARRCPACVAWRFSDCFFPVTCKLLPSRKHLGDSEFALLANLPQSNTTVKERREKVGDIRLNPVKRGLVKGAADWRGSSIHDYSGTGEGGGSVCLSTASCHLPISDPGYEGECHSLPGQASEVAGTKNR